MNNEPTPGVVSEEVALLDPQILYEHYLPTISESKPGGLSILEQEELKKTIVWFASAGEDLEHDARILRVKNFIEKFIEMMRKRPLASQIASLLKRYEENPEANNPQVYYAGSLITDKLYPDKENGYKELDTGDGIIATTEERKGGLFVKIYRDEKGNVNVRPILEKEKMFDFARSRHWKAQVELSKKFFPEIEHGQGQIIHKGRPLYERPSKVYDLLAPTHLLRGGFDFLGRKLNDDGNWDVMLEIVAKPLSVRNFERWVRAYALCLNFQITRENEPPSPKVGILSLHNKLFACLIFGGKFSKLY